MLPRYVTAAPYGIRANMPNMTYTHTTAEYKIEIRTNSKGIRSDREIPYAKQPDIKRIVLLGDSFGMGYGVNLEDTFTAHMAKQLNQNSSYQVEVVNLSSSGHGNAEELIALQNEGLKFQPDLVILAWHNTDIEDNVRSNLFRLNQGNLIKMSEKYLPGVKVREFLNQFYVYRFLSENSQIYNFFRNWAGEQVQELLVHLMSAKKHKNKQETQFQNDSTSKYEKGLTVALLNEIKKVCTDNNSNFMILDIPSRKTRTEFFSRIPIEYNNTDNPYKVVSPIAAFKEAKGEKLYWERSHGHFTPFGCQIVGTVLADFINKNKLLESM